METVGIFYGVKLTHGETVCKVRDMELIELIFKSKNIDPQLTVDTETDMNNGFTRTTQRYEINPENTLTGLKVTITVDKLWSNLKCVAEEYTLISYKTVRNLTAENIMTTINQHI